MNHSSSFTPRKRPIETRLRFQSPAARASATRQWSER